MQPSTAKGAADCVECNVFDKGICLQEFKVRLVQSLIVSHQRLKALERNNT
jgi:hypothetical protein